MLDTALRWRSLGFSLIPLVYGDKRPAVPWEWFQSHHATEAQLEAWFGGPALRNIGIVCGAISGVVAVDLDSAAAWAWADAHLPASPMRTGRRRGSTGSTGIRAGRFRTGRGWARWGSTCGRMAAGRSAFLTSPCCQPQSLRWRSAAHPRPDLA